MLSEVKHLTQGPARFFAVLGMTMSDIPRSDQPVHWNRKIVLDSTAPLALGRTLQGVIHALTQRPRPCAFNQPSNAERRIE